jgi:hypothetical protein
LASFLAVINPELAAPRIRIFFSISDLFPFRGKLRLTADQSGGTPGCQRIARGGKSAVMIIICVILKKISKNLKNPSKNPYAKILQMSCNL